MYALTESGTSFGREKSPLIHPCTTNRAKIRGAVGCREQFQEVYRVFRAAEGILPPIQLIHSNYRDSQSACSSPQRPDVSTCIVHRPDVRTWREATPSSSWHARLEPCGALLNVSP